MLCEVCYASLAKIKPSQIGNITLLFTDVGKSCPSREFLTWQICLLMLFVKLHICYAKFDKNKPLQIGKITLFFADVGKSCPSREFLTWQICLLMLFVKIKFSQ